jgi:hypothetical protein
MYIILVFFKNVVEPKIAAKTFIALKKMYKNEKFSIFIFLHCKSSTIFMKKLLFLKNQNSVKFKMAKILQKYLKIVIMSILFNFFFFLVDFVGIIYPESVFGCVI